MIDRLGGFDRADVQAALAAGTLALHLGPFSMGLRADRMAVMPFLMDLYRDVPASLEAGVLTDVALCLRAPNAFRRFVRPQVLPDPGFETPAIPLPLYMSGLAMEMGFNLAVALKIFRFTIVHGGVVADEKGGILISAASGGGKSTLTAALMQQGFRLFSDEFAIISDDAELVPYPRPVSLKNQSIDLVRQMAGAGEVSATIAGTPKGRIAYRRARLSDIKAAQKRARPKLILFPNFQKNAAPEVSKLEPADAMMRLITSSTNYRVSGETGFKAFTSMVQSAPAYEITYGTLEESVKLVQSLWERPV